VMVVPLRRMSVCVCGGRERAVRRRRVTIVIT